MNNLGLRRVLSTILVVASCTTALAVPQTAGAAGAPPANINAADPTVSGTLVAKPVSGEGNIPPVCLDRDQAAVSRAVQQNRGLVICTEEGKLVLLQLSPRTRFFNRDWRRTTVAQMRDGDHINAWGTLNDNGHLLAPTSVVQDTNITTQPPPRLQLVSGTLVAKPVNGERTFSSVCADRDQSTLALAAQQNRGLVICTAEGKLVLLELSSGTRIVSRFGGRITVALLTDGDHINAWGDLGDNGYLLNPTSRVQDTDLQGALTDSQDFIAQGGSSLMLMVLQSDSNGPVQGIVHAVPGGPARVVLCGDRLGTWDDLTQGKTIDITRSIFNRRTMTYLRTANVRVVSCP
jgi:hypothetical protein